MRRQMMKRQDATTPVGRGQIFLGQKPPEMGLPGLLPYLRDPICLASWRPGDYFSAAKVGSTQASSGIRPFSPSTDRERFESPGGHGRQAEFCNKEIRRSGSQISWVRKQPELA